MADFTQKWKRGTIASVLTTELNSLANNTNVVTATAYDNSTNLDTLVEVEVVCTFGVAPTANTGFAVWFLRAVDATPNYEDGSATVTPARAPDVVLPMRAVTTAQRVIRQGVLPPGTVHVLIRNDGTGQAIAATGNTLKVRSLTGQVTQQ